MTKSLLRKKTYNRILGIDASTNSIGFSVIENGKLINYGEIFFSGTSVFERLADAQKRIVADLSNVNPDLIVFESAIFVQNKQTVITLAYAFGAVVTALMKDGIDVLELPPITWQNHIGNKALTKDEKNKIKEAAPGRSDSWYSNQYREFRKQRTINWVKEKYDVEIESNNITDSIGVATTAWDKYGAQ